MKQPLPVKCDQCGLIVYSDEAMRTLTRTFCSEKCRQDHYRQKEEADGREDPQV